jgi:hypothetical protein
VCPVNSQISAQGCVCNSGYQLESCNGAPCSGSACSPNFMCGPIGGSGSSSGGSGSGASSSVCYMSGSVPLCSCASSQNIGSCSINANYGHSTGSCSGLDCCLTDQGGTCCDCASSSYLSSLGLTCASWIQQSRGTRVSSCP